MNRPYLCSLSTALLVSAFCFLRPAAIAAPAVAPTPPRTLFDYVNPVDQKLHREDMLRYVKETAFNRLQKKTGTEPTLLEREEFNAAFPVRPSEAEREYDKLARLTGGITSSTLYDVGVREESDPAKPSKDPIVLYWKILVDRTADVYWQRAHRLAKPPAEPEEPLTKEQLAPFVNDLNGREGQIRPSTVRLARLKALAGRGPEPKEIPKEAYLALRAEERWEALDADGNEIVDIREFRSDPELSYDAYTPGLPQNVSSIEEFLQFAGADRLMTQDEFTGKTDPKWPGSNLAFRIHTSAEKEWNERFLSLSLKPLPGRTGLRTDASDVRTVERALKQLEKEARAEQQKQALASRKFGPGFVRGPVFSGLVLNSRVYNPVTKGPDVDPRRPALIAHIVKEFTNTGGVDTDRTGLADKAQPTTLSHTELRKNGDSTDSLEIAGAVRFDYYHPRLYRHLVPSFGYEVSRTASKTKKKADPKETRKVSDVRRIYLLADLGFSAPGAFFRYNRIHIGPVFEIDTEENVEKLTGLIQWEPLVSVRGLSAEAPFLLGRAGRTYPSFYFVPRVALELGDITHKPVGSSDLDTSFVRPGVDAVLAFNSRLQLKYVLKPRFGVFGSRKDFLYQDLTLEWAFLPDSRMSLVFDYTKGEDSPSFDEVEQFKVGLGVRF